MPDPGIPGPITRRMRRIRRKAARTTLVAMRNSMIARMSAGGPPQELLLVCDGRVYTSEQQFAPILRQAPALARRYAIAVRTQSLEGLVAAGPAGAAGTKLLGLMLPFDMPPNEEQRIVTEIIEPVRRAGTRVVLFDGDDDLGVLWYDVLAKSDLCLKKHALADRADYGRRMIGKSNLTDHVARHHGSLLR